MSTAYPGTPAIARTFWRAYGAALFGMSVTTLFAGAFGALVTYQLAPEAMIFYGVALASLVVHLSAIYISDVWSGAYEPEQTKWTTGTLVFAVVVVLGVQVSGLLLIATAGAVLLTAVGSSVLVAAFVAAYYPIVDIVMMRNGWVTPGNALFVCVVLLVGGALDARQPIAELVPIIGRNRRPQS